MIPQPQANGLMLCDYAVIEEQSRKPTLVGLFGRFRLQVFPSLCPPFVVFASLMDGLGQGALELTITHLASDEEVHRIESTIQFPNRFAEVGSIFRINDCYLPEPGDYLFSLYIDNEIITERRIEAALRGLQA